MIKSLQFKSPMSARFFADNLICCNGLTLSMWFFLNSSAVDSFRSLDLFSPVFSKS